MNSIYTVKVKGSSNKHKVDASSLSCDCLDFIYRRSYRSITDPNRLCKHLIALKDKGLLTPLSDNKSYSKFSRKFADEVLIPEITSFLKFKGIESFDIFGSYKRGKTELKDLDVVIKVDKTFNWEAFRDAISKHCILLASGSKKFLTVRNNYRLDLFFTYDKQSLIFTQLQALGPATLNIELRKIMKSKLLLLNDKGLWDRVTGKRFKYFKTLSHLQNYLNKFLD